MHKLLGYVLGCIAWLYARTFRVRRVHGERLHSPSLFAIWHEHQMPAILSNPDPSMVTIASRSKDGDIITGALRVLGFPVARGSSSRGGAQALRQLQQWVGKGHSAAITVDGPRGPRHGCKPGIVALAKATGVPILPTAIVSERAWRTRSWDRFMIPKPFTRMVQVYGELIYVREGDDVQATQAQVARALETLNQEGEAAFESHRH